MLFRLTVSQFEDLTKVATVMGVSQNEAARSIIQNQLPLLVRQYTGEIRSQLAPLPEGFAEEHSATLAATSETFAFKGLPKQPREFPPRDDGEEIIDDLGYGAEVDDQA